MSGAAKKKPTLSVAPDLAARAQKKWQSSGLTDDHAETLQLSPVTIAEAHALGCKFTTTDALRVPYFDEDGNETEFFRLRFLHTDQPKPTGFDALVKPKKPLRFWQPAGTVNQVYMAPLLDRAWSSILDDTNTTLYITEGELKAACATARGFPTLGLGGVNNFCAKKRGLSFLPTLDRTNWQNRTVYIVFDSDAATKPGVTKAQHDLAHELVARGALVRLVTLPPPTEGEKQGLDDFLIAHGDDELREVLKRAKPADESEELFSMNDEVVFVRKPVSILVRKDGQTLFKEKFKDLYAPRCFYEPLSRGGARRVATADRWLEWPQRSEVAGITYAPGQPTITTDGKWNLWRGWPHEPVPGNIKPWTELLDVLFKDDTPESRRWFEQWCAYPIQHPGEKLHTAVVFWSSVQGVGKSMLGEILMRVYGENSQEIDRTDLHDTYNSWAFKKQFVVGDEITGSDKREEADRVKGIITRSAISINEKFEPKFTVPNCVNYLFTSQHPNAFRLEESDRRFFVVHVNGPVREPAFYDRVREWKNGDGPSHLFHHLLQVDLTGFNPSSPAPMTAAKAAMIVDSRSELETWVAKLIADMADPEVNTDLFNGLTVNHGKNVRTVELLTARQLLQCYGGDASRQTALSRALKSAGINQYDKTVRTSRGHQNFYILRNHTKWARASPQEVRDHWEPLFGELTPKKPRY